MKKTPFSISHFALFCIYLFIYQLLHVFNKYIGIFESEVYKYSIYTSEKIKLVVLINDIFDVKS